MPLLPTTGRLRSGPCTSLPGTSYWPRGPPAPARLFHGPATLGAKPNLCLSRETLSDPPMSCSLCVSHREQSASPDTAHCHTLHLLLSPPPVPQLTAASANTLWPTFAGPVRCSSFGAQWHLVRSLFIISLQAGLRGRPRASSPRPSSPNEPHLASDTQADADFRGRAHSDGHPAPSPHTQRIKRVPCCASIKEFSVAIHRHDEKESGERFHANQRLKIR